MARRLVLAAIAIVSACVDQGPGPQPRHVDGQYILAHLLKSIPSAVDPRLDADLDGQIVYLGNHVDRTTLIPGAPFKVVHYWQVKQAPGPGWRVFTLLRGGDDSADFMNLEITDMELGHGPSTWKPGEIIEDIEDVTLRPDWRTPTATLLVGLIHVGAHGVDDRMIVRTANQDRAIVARTFDVDLSRAPPPPGTIYIPRAKGAIAIDGLANDPGWAGVPSSPEFATAEGAGDSVGKATARMTWDDTYLYLFVNVTDSDIYSPYKQHDDSLWKADDVEIFIDADRNGHGYVELQVNPNNATFDSWFATTRAQPGDVTWDSNMVTAVKVRGTADKEGDSDTGWDAEVAIPWEAVKGRDANMKVRLPPAVGDRWRLNVVRVDKKTGEATPNASSWNRISSADYHALDRMLTAVFADETGSIVPKPDDGSGSAGSGSGSAGSGSAASGSAASGSAASGTGSAAAGTASGSASAGSASVPEFPAMRPRMMRHPGPPPSAGSAAPQ